MSDANTDIFNLLFVVTIDIVIFINENFKHNDKMSYTSDNEKKII